MAGFGDDTRNDALTSNKVAGMSAQARSDLARQLNDASDDTAASYRRSDRPVRREPAPRDRTGGRPAERKGDSREPAAAERLASSLQRTERRLKTGGAMLSQGRTVRLTSRAQRLKRQLRRVD